MTVASRKPIGVGSYKVFTPISHRSQNANIDISFRVSGSIPLLKQWMVTNRQVQTTHPCRATSGNPSQMNVEPGAGVRSHDQIAVEPLALGLFGAQQKEMFCQTLNLLPWKLMT